MSHTIKWSAALTFTVFIAVMISQNSNSKHQLVVTPQIPALKLTDLESREAVDLDLIEGSYILNIWGSWCVACAREHDLLMQLQESGVRIIGVAYMDTTDNAIEWLNSRGTPYALSLIDDNGLLGSALNIKGAPESYLIDNAGEIIYKHTGMLTAENWPTIAAKLKQIE